MIHVHHQSDPPERPARSHFMRTQAGQSLLETTLVLPVLLLIMVGVLDLGRALHVYTIVFNAAREGARYAALYPDDSLGIRDAVEQEATGASLDLAQSVVTIETPYGTAPGQPITVRLAYEFSLLTELIVGSKSLPIRAATTMVIE